jgi:molecular chaperone DnaJ
LDDLYAVLGIPKTATAEEIKKAYRDAAFKYHPDRNPGDKGAEEKFKAITAAYAVLGDEAQRRDYDRYGSADDFARASSSGRQETGGTGDPFWDWFNDMQRQGGGERRTYTWYGPFDSWQKKGGQDDYSGASKSSAFGSLLRSVLILFAGVFFFRFSWFILPIGPILSIGAIINGAIGAIRSLKRLFTSPKT